MAERLRCVYCGGPIFQRYSDGPWLHVNLEDLAAGVHDPSPQSDVTEPDREGDE